MAHMVSSRNRVQIIPQVGLSGWRILESQEFLHICPHVFVRNIRNYMGSYARAIYGLLGGSGGLIN